MDLLAELINYPLTTLLSEKKRIHLILRRAKGAIHISDSNLN